MLEIFKIIFLNKLYKLLKNIFIIIINISLLYINK